MGKWVIFIGDEKFTPQVIKGMVFEGTRVQEGPDDA